MEKLTRRRGGAEEGREDRAMGLFPKQVAWSEPWSWEDFKEKFRQGVKELPSLWRLVLWVVVLPTVVLGVAKAFLQTIEWIQVLGVVLGFPVFLLLLVFMLAACPVTVHVLAAGIMFQVGSSAFRIDVKNITSISFETHGGRRYFVVRAKTPRGVPFERRALLPKKKVTEQDIIEFLYESDLAHLVRHGRTNDARRVDGVEGEKRNS